MRIAGSPELFARALGKALEDTGAFHQHRWA